MYKTRILKESYPKNVVLMKKNYTFLTVNTISAKIPLKGNSMIESGLTVCPP